MRSLLAGLLVALIIAAVALAVAAFGALGVAAIGWVLNRWFDLTQWQGSLIALTVALGLGYLVFRLATPSAPSPWEGEWGDWEDDEDDKEEEPVNEEPPIVPWRRTRPTPGELPEPKPTRRTDRPTGKRR